MTYAQRNLIRTFVHPLEVKQHLSEQTFISTLSFSSAQVPLGLPGRVQQLRPERRVGLRSANRGTQLARLGEPHPRQPGKNLRRPPPPIQPILIASLSLCAGQVF